MLVSRKDRLAASRETDPFSGFYESLAYQCPDINIHREESDPERFKCELHRASKIAGRLHLLSTGRELRVERSRSLRRFHILG